MCHLHISLLIPRRPHFVGQSDACNIDMGGLCFPLIIQLSLSNSVFRCLPDWRAASPYNPVFHIKIHQFIALIINDFFMMIYFTDFHHQGSPIITDLDGLIFLLEAGNTSALSCMSRISCMQESHIVNLCHLFSHIVLYFNTMFPYRFDGQIMAGVLKVEADALSCPHYHPIYK